MIPYGFHNVNQKDIDQVISVLRSDYLTQGPVVPEFEKSIASYCSAKFGVAVSSATSALHIACLSLGLGPGDYLWTSPITFVASANCGLYCGAQVDFVDIDSNTYNMCPTALENKLIQAKKHGKLPKVVIPVHFAGQSCNMDAIFSLSKKYGFKIIEDASHAIGGKYKDDPIGNCRYSDITIFSFHPVKIITSAEGGMAVTNDFELYEKMCLYRSHGITRDPLKMKNNLHGPWYYEQISLGYNYRMTELQAALGLSQLNRVDEFVKSRNKLAREYNLALNDAPVTLPQISDDCYSAFHLYVILLENKNTELHRIIFENLRELGVGVNLHYIPVHLQPYYENIGFRKGDFPLSENYYTKAISIPIYPQLEEQKQKHVINSIYKVVSFRSTP